MTENDNYTRRVCAVLLADVSAFSALMGEDEEGTARAVDDLRTLIVKIVAETAGRAEPTAGDAFFATFGSVVAAVDAALRIQEAMRTRQFAGHELRIRIGVHVGDVLFRADSAFGDAINIAARLEALARPGTVCVSESVYRQVRTKFDHSVTDLGRQRLKNISDPMRVYLIGPPAHQVSRGLSRRRLMAVAGGAGAAALGLGTALLLWRTDGWLVSPTERTAATLQEARPAAVAPTAAGATGEIVLGVMGFKSPGGERGHAWMREALRDGLNAELSQLASVKIYSKEFIDFVITRQNLSEVEAATRLGVSKMLSGSFLILGETVRIETHVVDVASGVLEASYSIEGTQKEFLDLQRDMVFGIISRLDIPVTPEERELLAAKRETNVDALRLLMESEQGGVKHVPAPATDESTSWLLRWLPRMRLQSAFIAWAGETQAELEIVALLERYRTSLEARDVDRLASVYAEFTSAQREAHTRYFESIEQVQVILSDVDIAVVGPEAVVSFTRTDDFKDVLTGRPMHHSVRLTKLLVLNGGWRISGSK